MVERFLYKLYFFGLFIVNKWRFFEEVEFIFGRFVEEKFCEFYLFDVLFKKWYSNIIIWRG